MQWNYFALFVAQASLVLLDLHTSHENAIRHISF